MKIKIFLLFLALATLIALTACQSSAKGDQPVLRVMTHDSFAISEDLIREFEQENNIKVVFIPSGDTGAALNRAILSKNSPQADLFYGVDNTFLSRALSENIFEPYQSPQIANIFPELVLDSSYRLLPVDFGDVCINYDKAFFADKTLPLPVSLLDLTHPDYRGLLVVENPATSSPGLAFLMATIAEFGEDGYLQFWKDLRENDIVVVNDWETAYYTNFSASSGQGSQPMVVSYSSSPAAEVIFAEEVLTEAPTASLTGENMCFRQVEFAGILAGTKNRDMAEKLIDFFLSVPFQEDIPLQMFVYPANSLAKIPSEFEKFAPTAPNPAGLEIETIASRRDQWIEDWTSAVLR